MGKGTDGRAQARSLGNASGDGMSRAGNGHRAGTRGAAHERQRKCELHDVSSVPAGVFLLQFSFFLESTKSFPVPVGGSWTKMPLRVLSHAMFRDVHFSPSVCPRGTSAV